MRISDRAGPAGAALLAVLLAGCSSVVDGDPVATPGLGPATEPSVSTPRLPRPTSSSPLPSAPTTPPGGTTTLPPNDNGYVFIETKSGKTRCQINSDSVGCEAAFTNSPMKDGSHANGVSINAAGDVQWVLGNLGDIPTVAIDYRTYAAQGWTIGAGVDGTRFTNDHTGHGMFVSIDNVETY